MPVNAKKHTSSLRVEHDLEQALKPYIIQDALPHILRMLANDTVRVAFSNRKGSTLGYFKPEEESAAPRPTLSQMQTISLQIDLNPYALLFVFLHEWAHLTTQKQYGETVRAHGKEWKANFRRIFTPFHDNRIFPPDILTVIDAYFVKTGRYFETDLDRACKRYGNNRKEFTRVYFEFLKKGIEIPAPYMGGAQSTLRKENARKREEERREAIRDGLAAIAREKQEKAATQVAPRYNSLGNRQLSELSENELFRFENDTYRLIRKEGAFATALSLSRQTPLRLHTMVEVEKMEQA